MVSANTKPLSEFKTGEFVQIEKIQLEGTMKRRLLDLGFIPAQQLKYYNVAHLEIRSLIK